MAPDGSVVIGGFYNGVADYGGGPMPGLIEFFLHAESVRLGELTVIAPLPDDRRAVLAALGLADAVPSAP